MLHSSFFFTNLDCLEPWLCLVVHCGDGTLQYLPGDALTTTRLAHQHRGVSRVFGLVELDDFGHGEGGYLQTTLMQLHLYDLFQLKHYKLC